ncbi:MAG: hypothetical protein JW776_09385 [Candidatus Lokiarchaeota archaeon]|nr:hypothetical protein [Candidatus Lokiarchaeota archaeon]
MVFIKQKTLAELFLDLDNDPILVQLALAINKFQGITANRLKKIFFFSGNKIYYYLSKLEKKKIIYSEEEKIKRNFIQKKYYAKLQYEDQGNFLESFRNAEKKEHMILRLSMMCSLLQRQINQIQKLSQEEYEQRKGEISQMSELYTIRGKLSPKLKKLFTELQETLKEESLTAFGSNLEARLQADHIGYFGFLPMY